MSAESANPSPARLATEWTFAGQSALIMENRLVRVVILPSLGGKIISLVDKRADLELIWRNDRVPVRPAAFGSSYDDQFIGGWDELFPNDSAEELAGEPYPDHGEVWSLPWSHTAGVDDGTAWVELSVRTPISVVAATKRLSLAPDSAALVVDYTVRNEGRHDLPFLWKLHVAVALQSDTTIDMAATDVLLHEFGSPRSRPESDRFVWPGFTADGVDHDLRTLPDTGERGISEFSIAEGLSAGFCGVIHPGHGSGLTLYWDPAELPSCWLFASYGGGWRGLNVLVMEPCTGYALSVAEGAEAGTHQVLPAGTTRTWRVVARVGVRPTVAESVTTDGRSPVL